MEKVSYLGGRRHIYLFEWVRDRDFFWSEMAYRMKGNRSAFAWKYYAALLAEPLKMMVTEYGHEGLVPVPGTNSYSVHAKLFANELSALTGLPVLDLLTKKSGLEQKKKSAVDRKADIMIERKTGWSEYFTKLVLIDDIVTTGESVLQSDRALANGDENLIVSLFYRPKRR